MPTDGGFTGLGQDGGHIAQVVQKTVLKADEQGTEAAAATGVAMDTAAVAVHDEIVTFDRPFLFLLTDTATRSPLFVTLVSDPS